MKEFGEYCKEKRVRVVHLDDAGCELDLSRSPKETADFFAESPLGKEGKVPVLEMLQGVIDKDGFKVLGHDNWKILAEPIGGIPPKGGMLRFVLRF